VGRRPSISDLIVVISVITGGEMAMTKLISASIRPAMIVLSMVASASAQTAPPLRPAATAAEKPSAVPQQEAEISDDPWEERKARAREDVEYLEIFQGAKQAEFREAELRFSIASAWKVDMDRQNQKGYTSTFTKNQGDLSLAEALTQREMRRSEVKDVEIRLARARRRLKAVERSGASPEPEISQSDDRLRELERKYERLRADYESTKREVGLSAVGKKRP
jgi:chromosome segregation ATPase